MKRFWNKLTGEERLCRAEQKLTILILDCQDEERRVKLIRRKKEVHLKRLKIRRRNYIFALILACMMLILAVYGVVRVIGKMIKNVPIMVKNRPSSLQKVKHRPRRKIQQGSI